MPLGILIIAVQIAFGVHVIRTGRQFFWLYLIIFIPLLGCLIYFFAEIVPELRHTRTAQRATSKVTRALNSEKNFRALVAAVEDVPTADNRRKLAEAVLARGEIDRALALYEAALAPPHQTDPVLLMGLARCQFQKGKPEAALATLDRLQEGNPGFQSNEGHLLYAMALEAAGRLDEALAEYDVLSRIYPGEEARGRYALLLKRCGRPEEAAELFRTIVRSVERANRHYQKQHREWSDAAKQALAE